MEGSQLAAREWLGMAPIDAQNPQPVQKSTLLELMRLTQIEVKRALIW